MSNSRRFLFLTSMLLACGLSLSEPHVEGAAKSGDIHIRVVDQASGKPVPCRIHLKNSRGFSRKAPKLPFLKDHFVCDGTLDMELREGTYTFEIECGPEYHTRVGHFSIDRFSDDTKVIPMRRVVDMAAEGWWAGDLDIRRRPREVPLLMRAEGIHVGEVVTWSDRKIETRDRKPNTPHLVDFDQDRTYSTAVGRDHRAGGGLIYHHLEAPPEGFVIDKNRDAEYPAAVALAVATKRRHDDAVWIEADATLCWDLPVWIAHGVVDSIQLAGHRFGRNGSIDSEPGHRPRDKESYPGVNGLGRWSEQVYYHLLNCGLRIPPTAGSGSGGVPSPVGYNRVYAYCGDTMTYASWWDAVRAGRVMVTNGPLLRPTVEGQRPGHRFRGELGKTLRLQIELQLATKDKVEYLEVVQDGDVTHVVRLDEFVKQAGQLPPLEFKKSGWFLVRAVTNTPETYRFASSGPFYVEIGDKPIVRRQSAQFFLDWVIDRARRLALKDKKQHAEVLGLHRAARDFWQARVDQADRE